MIFNYEYKCKLENLTRLIKFDDIKILDFGCGKGIWSVNQVKNESKVKKILLYDKNKILLNYLKEKYKFNKFEISSDLEEILKKDYNVIIFSSVIQYLDPNELRLLIGNLTHNKKKILVLIIDIPFLPRYLEFLLMPFFNIKRFIFSLSLFFSNDYKKIKYFTYKKEDFKIYENKFKINYFKNLHDLKVLRYSLLLEKID